jgi:2-oxoglutarate ferredoxin oxidoreductase subunit alpha
MTEIPCVIVNVMRGGPSTGLPTLPAQGDVMQARWGTHGDHGIIVLCPRGVRETYDLTVRAFNLAEVYRTPVTLLLDEIIGHVNEKVSFPTSIRVVERAKPDASVEKYLPYEYTESDIPPMASFGQGYRFHVTGLCHDETGFPTNNSEKIDRHLQRLNRKIERYADRIIEAHEDVDDDPAIGVIAYGSTARSAARAVRMAREGGLRVAFLAPTVLWPFPKRHVEKIGGLVRDIVVPEMNFGQYAHEIEWAVGRDVRVHRVNRVDGEPIRPQEILDRIHEVLKR